MTALPSYGSPEDTRSPSSALVIAPRRGLPTGRALLGALLVTAATVGAFAIATRTDTGPTTEYLVLVDDIGVGDPIELADVELAAMTLPAEIEASAVRGTEGLEGATALNPLRAGSILDRRELRGAAFIGGEPITSVHELTFPVPLDRTPAVLTMGDRVTVLAFDQPADVLRTALEDAVVLAFDADPTGIGSSDQGRLTLAVPDADVVLESTRWSYDALTVVLTTRAIDDTYRERFGSGDAPAADPDVASDDPT